MYRTNQITITCRMFSSIIQLPYTTIQQRGEKSEIILIIVPDQFMHCYYRNIAASGRAS